MTKKAPPVVWEESEWADGGLSAWVDGIVADVVPSTVYGPPDPEAWGGPRLAWSWEVKPSSSRCEYPEMFDAGEAHTQAGACRAAAAAARRADARYQHVTY